MCVGGCYIPPARYAPVRVLQILVLVRGCYNTLLFIQVTLKAYTDAIYKAYTDAVYIRV